MSRRPTRARPKNGPRKPPRGAAARSAGEANKRPAAPPDDRQRLQKVMAAAGIASRRECEQLILEGRVEVNGEPSTELGVRVDPTTDEVRVDGEPLRSGKRTYYAVHKPQGYVCTARDPSGRPRVTDLLPPSAGRVFHVGRLDMASEGLILLTNDGELANGLMHPRHGVQKTYHVQVAGRITPEELTQARKGVYLADGKAHFVGARIKSHHKKSSILEVVLDEGRNREIRRVLASLGHKVQRLTRVAIGPVRLGEMPAGAYRPLTREEIRGLRDCVVQSSLDRKPPPKRRSKRSGNRSAAPGGEAAPRQRRIIK